MAFFVTFGDGIVHDLNCPKCGEVLPKSVQALPNGSLTACRKCKHKFLIDYPKRALEDRTALEYQERIYEVCDFVPKEKGAALSLKKVVNHMALEGWTFQGIEQFVSVGKPGCLGALLGLGAIPVTTHVLVFYKIKK